MYEVTDPVIKEFLDVHPENFRWSRFVKIPEVFNRFVTSVSPSLFLPFAGYVEMSSPPLLWGFA